MPENLHSLVSINREMFSEREARISVFDRGFLFGDSVYEVTLARDRVPLFLERHFDRLWCSAEALSMPLQFSREDLRSEIQKGLDLLAQNEAYIRLVITRGEGPIGLAPELATRQNLVIFFKEFPPTPKEWYREGVHMHMVAKEAYSWGGMSPSIKSGNYLHNILATHKAKEKGLFDAILVNHLGHVTEGTTSNIWIVREGTVFTPPLKAGLLSGVTRAILLTLGREDGLAMKEENFTPETLKTADEVFFSSSTRELVPITKVDHQTIGHGHPGPITKRLHNLYKKAVEKAVRQESP